MSLRFWSFLTMRHRDSPVFGALLSLRRTASCPHRAMPHADMLAVVPSARGPVSPTEHLAEAEVFPKEQAHRATTKKRKRIHMACQSPFEDGDLYPGCRSVAGIITTALQRLALDDAISSFVTQAGPGSGEHARLAGGLPRH